MPHTSRAVLSGDCSIREIGSVRNALVAALDDATELAIDCGAIERADMAFVQVVVSAAVLAERQGKRLSLTHVPPAVEAIFLRGGLSTRMPGRARPQ